jgi:hypothetical protein
MSSPAWFFSTLAQSAAAVIGLTVAFTVSTHLSRRERVNRKSKRLREELIDFRNRYRDILFNISSVLEEQADFDPSYDVGRNLADAKYDRGQWVESQSATPVAAEVWGCTYGVAHMLTNVNDLEDLPGDQEFGRLREAISQLQDILDINYERGKQLYEEITDSPADSTSSNYYHEDIFEEKGRMKHWLTHTTNARRVNTVTMTPDDSRLTGKNLFSLATLVREMENDSIDIAPLTADTRITDDFMSPDYTQRIIRTCGKLGIVGVLAPITLLISPAGASIPLWNQFLDWIPDWIPNFGWVAHYTTILIEVGLVATSAIFSYQLFRIMLREVGHEPPRLGDILVDDAYWSKDDPKSRRTRAYIARIIFGERLEDSNEPSSISESDR